MCLRIVHISSHVWLNLRKFWRFSPDRKKRRRRRIILRMKRTFLKKLYIYIYIYACSRSNHYRVESCIHLDNLSFSRETNLSRLKETIFRNIAKLSKRADPRCPPKNNQLKRRTFGRETNSFETNPLSPPPPPLPPWSRVFNETQGNRAISKVGPVKTWKTQ